MYDYNTCVLKLKFSFEYDNCMYDYSTTCFLGLKFFFFLKYDGCMCMFRDSLRNIKMYRFY